MVDVSTPEGGGPRWVVPPPDDESTAAHDPHFASPAPQPPKVQGPMFRPEGAVRPEPRAGVLPVQQVVPVAGPPNAPPPTAPPPLVPPPLVPPGGKPPKRRKKRGLRRILKLVALFVIIYVTAVVTVFALNVTKIGSLPASSVTSSGTNFLLVGSDSRAGLTDDQKEQLHTGSVEGGRTDTIMVMHVPWFGTPTLVSIPRDSWVPIPGHGEGKINSAFAIGGPDLMVSTVEQSTGLHIDHYVEVGFAGVANVTDALGGVRLCPADNYNDENSGLNVKAGCQTMDGPTALAYVRMRYADPRGDLGRVQRQQEFMSSVAKQAANPITWLLPWRSFGMADAAGSSLIVDNGTHVWDDAQLALAMGMVAIGAGDSTTVPTEPDTYYVDGQDALKWNTPEALALFDSLGA